MRFALLAAALLGCGTTDRELTVLAAASLTDAFEDLAEGFERAHPEVEVVLATAGSQTLATQIRHGLAADVYASADESYAAALHADGFVSAPARLAANRLVIAIPADAAGPTSLEALPDAGTVLLAGVDVPLGRYTEVLLDAATAEYGTAWRAAVDGRVASREPHARLVTAKLALGEADAAVVYATDVRASEGLRAIEVPTALAPSPAAFHATLSDPVEPALAAAWMAWVDSDAGQTTLAAHGFEAGS